MPSVREKNKIQVQEPHPKESEVTGYNKNSEEIIFGMKISSDYTNKDCTLTFKEVALIDYFNSL